MQDGDITDDVPFRFLIIFEDLVGFAPERRAHKVQEWSLDARMTSVLWDIQLHTPYSFDLVTLRGKKFAEAMEARLERDHVPFDRFFWADLDAVHTEQQCPPYYAVIHGREDWDLGARQVCVTNPQLFDVPTW